MLKSQSLVRIRPAIGNELLQPHMLQLGIDDRTVTVAGPRDFALTCDRVLSSGFTQQLVFNTTVQPMIDDSLLEDRVPVLFVCGPLHSGKSYTVEGSQSDSALAGILYNSISYLFANDASEVYVSSLGFGPMERMKNLLTPSEQPQDVTPLFNQRAYPSVTYPRCAYPLTQAADVVDLVRLSRRHAMRMEQTDWMHKMWVLDYQIQSQYGRIVTVELAIFPSPRGSDLLLQSLLVRLLTDIRHNHLEALPIREHRLLSCLRDSFHPQLGSITFLLCMSQVVRQEDLESNTALLYALFPYPKESIPTNKSLGELINSKLNIQHTSLHASQTASSGPGETDVHDGSTLPAPGTSEYYSSIGQRYKESCKDVSLNYVKEQLKASNRILQSIIDEGKSPHGHPLPGTEQHYSARNSPINTLRDSLSVPAVTHTSITATPQILRHDRVLASVPSNSNPSHQAHMESDSQHLGLRTSSGPETPAPVISSSEVIREKARGVVLNSSLANRPLDPKLACAPIQPEHSPSTFDDSLVPQTVAHHIRSSSAQVLRRTPRTDQEASMPLTPVRQHLPATPSSAIHLGKIVTGSNGTAQSINLERDHQLEKLRRREEESTSRIHVLELDVSKKSSQLKQMEVLLKDALQQNESHLVKIESMNKLIEELRTRPQVTVQHLASQEREEYEARIATLSTSVIQRDNEIHSLHHQTEQLRGLLNQTTKFQAYADSLGTTLEPSQQLLDGRIDAMLADLATKDKQLEDLSRENDELQQLLHKMRGDLADHERLLGDLGYYKGLVTELGNVKVTLSAEVEQLKAENEVFRLENQHLHDDIKRLREDYEQARAQASRAEEVTSEVASMSQRYLELEKKYEDVIRDGQNARAEAASKDATIESLSRQIGYLKGIEKTLTHISGAMTQVPMDATVRVPVASSAFNPGSQHQDLDFLNNNISRISGRDQ